MVERETSWNHIKSSAYVCLDVGVPFKYYIDSHSIFRFVERRDSFYFKYRLNQEGIDPQWKQVLKDLKIDFTYALSPQAKGKVERPYRWLQDHLVRTCARENIRDIKQAREILRKEINHYNYHQVHSTTGEIPSLRFEKALKENKSLFRPYKTPPPYQSTKDIFCIRIERTTDAYRRISVDNLLFKIPINPHERIQLRLVPNEKTGLTEIRFWHKNNLVLTQNVKNSELRRVHF